MSQDETNETISCRNIVFFYFEQPVTRLKRTRLSMILGRRKAIADTYNEKCITTQLRGIKFI